jgi:hypothetical protein
VIRHQSQPLRLAPAATQETWNNNGSVCSVFSSFSLFSLLLLVKHFSSIHLLRFISITRSNFFFAIMGSKYQPVQDDEKPQESFARRSSTSTADSTLLEDEEDLRMTRPQSRFGPRWVWVTHVVLLSLSFTMFMTSLFSRASTLEHVERFSAYCESTLDCISRIQLIRSSTCQKSDRIPKSEIQCNNGRGITICWVWS